MANSPYHLVKGYPDQQLIKQSAYERRETKANNSIVFDHQKGRTSIENSLAPHEQRFALSENYDKSTFLTKVKKIPIRDFNSYVGRNFDKLIAQGGDVFNRDAIEPGARS